MREEEAARCGTTTWCCAAAWELARRGTRVPELEARSVAAGLNLLCQLLALGGILSPAVSAPLLAVTGLPLFAALAVFAATILNPREVARLWSTGGARLALPRQRAMARS